MLAATGGPCSCTGSRCKRQESAHSVLTGRREHSEFTGGAFHCETCTFKDQLTAWAQTQRPHTMRASQLLFELLPHMPHGLFTPFFGRNRFGPLHVEYPSVHYRFGPLHCWHS